MYYTFIYWHTRLGRIIMRLVRTYGQRYSCLRWLWHLFVSIMRVLKCSGGVREFTKPVELVEGATYLHSEVSRASVLPSPLLLHLPSDFFGISFGTRVEHFWSRVYKVFCIETFANFLGGSLKFEANLRVVWMYFSSEIKIPCIRPTTLN